jgi:hypothetical protein
MYFILKNYSSGYLSIALAIGSVYLFYKSNSVYALKTFKVLHQNINAIDYEDGSLTTTFNFDKDSTRVVTLKNIEANHREMLSAIEHITNNRPQNQDILFPESLFEVTFDDKRIVLSHPNKISEIEKWENIERIEVKTNDGGPFYADYWLVIYSESETIEIPQGATNYEQILEKVLKLKGLDLETFIKSSGSVTNKTFSIWSRN